MELLFGILKILPSKLSFKWLMMVSCGWKTLKSYKPLKNSLFLTTERTGSSHGIAKPMIMAKYLHISLPWMPQPTWRLRLIFTILSSMPLVAIKHKKKLQLQHLNSNKQVVKRYLITLKPKIMWQMAKFLMLKMLCQQDNINQISLHHGKAAM